MLYHVRDPDMNAERSKLARAVTRKAYVDNHTRNCLNDNENNMNTNKITNVGSPVSGTDERTKSMLILKNILIYLGRRN